MKLPKPPFTRLEAIAFAVGMAVLTFELVAARVTTPYLGDTIYTWTSIIGVILAALAFGVFKGGAWADKRQQPSDIVLCLLVAAVLIVILNFTKDAILGYIATLGMSLQSQAFLASLVLFAPTTFVLGIISPYLARLSIHSVQTSGRHLSRIDAFTTIGSLTGTFLTGFILFGLFGSRHLLSYIAIGLVLVSFLIRTKRYLPWQIGALALIVLTSVISPKPLVEGFISELDTAYSRIIIRNFTYNGQQLRVYQTDPDGLQSGIYANGSKAQPFAYIRGFSYLSDLRPAADRYLIIGGGAFTFPSYLANKEPKSVVDTVEIDEQLPEVSRQYFNFEQPQNLRIINQDGRAFLNRNNTKYDMIFVDAFNAAVPPFQLFTREAASRMHNSLNDDGVMVANVLSATDGLHGLMARYIHNTFKTEFPYLTVYSAQPKIAERNPYDTQNLLLIGSSKPLDAQRLTSLGTKHKEFAGMLASNIELASSDQRLIMTDDYSPIEQLAL